MNPYLGQSVLKTNFIHSLNFQILSTELAPQLEEYFQVIKGLLMQTCLRYKDLHFRQPLTSGFSVSLVVSKHLSE